jgi:hypothetical protein
MEVIYARQAVDVGWLRPPEDDAVAAVCCCRTQARLMLKRQTWPSPWPPCPNAMLASARLPELSDG